VVFMDEQCAIRSVDFQQTGHAVCKEPPLKHS
jgi:hypothetical protein